MFQGILVRDSFQKSKSLLSLHDESSAFYTVSFCSCIALFDIWFVSRMHANGIKILLSSYLSVFLVITVLCAIYLFILYGFVSRFNFKVFINTINMAPAGFTGFTTVSSAATLPMTVICSKKNVSDHDIVHGVVPATANTHLIGDCFAIPILSFVVMLSYGQSWPNFYDFLVFTIFFVMAKFAVAAVPAGGILVMLPVLHTHLGFDSDAGFDSNRLLSSRSDDNSW